MFLDAISLTAFKNFEKLELSFQQGVHFILGLNGAGKTNLLDAIYYSCLTKSFFQTSDKSLIKHDHEFFRAVLHFKDVDKNHQLIIKCKPPGLKEFIWDDILYEKVSNHIGKVPVVLIVPDDIYTFINDSEVRRRFLNQSLVQIDALYLEHLLIYNRILKQRNALLKNSSISVPKKRELMDIYDQRLVDSGTYIYKMRSHMIIEISRDLNGFVESISQHDQQASLEYQSDAIGNYNELMNRSRERDLLSQRTNVGIHKDRIIPKLGERALRDFGSQGQIKTFIIALRLAQYRFLLNQSQQKPLLLLDDLFAKLDEERIKKLMQIIESLEIPQVFITDTDEKRAKRVIQYSQIPHYFHYIYKGNVIDHE
ncbi:MAG: DNA replication and repair protein RecF [Bacteroidota bacterium]|nr:DNA replication and repair protein RecF [Bacteroidota bacterium]